MIKSFFAVFFFLTACHGEEKKLADSGRGGAVSDAQTLTKQVPPSATSSTSMRGQDPVVLEGATPSSAAPESPTESLLKIAQAEFSRAKNVGHTFVVLKLTTLGGQVAAFRPRTRSDSDGYKSEVAAYRLAELCGLRNVPATIAVTLPIDRLRAAFATQAEWNIVRAQLIATPNGRVDGALTTWVFGLRDLDPNVPRSVELERELAAMSAFDFLIANWDRHSGGNIKVDSMQKLVIRDHNVAFSARLSSRQDARLEQALRLARSASPEFRARVIGLDRGQISAALSDLLTPNELEALFARHTRLTEALD